MTPAQKRELLRILAFALVLVLIIAICNALGVDQ